MATPSRIKQVLISATDLGAACGVHPYRSSDTVKRKVLKKVFPKINFGTTESVAMAKEAAAKEAVERAEEVVEVLAIAGAKGEAAARDLEEARAQIKARPECAAAKEALVTAATKASELVVAAAASKIAGATTGKAGMEEVEAMAPVLKALPATSDAARSCGYTKKGLMKEAEILEAFQKESGALVEKPTKYKKRQVKGKVWVGGYLDAFGTDAEGRPIVVEVKTRQGHFFDAIPERELYQIYAYMFVTRVKRAVWVQGFKGEVRHEEVLWDSEVWDLVVEGLEEFRGDLEASAAEIAAGKA